MMMSEAEWEPEMKIIGRLGVTLIISGCALAALLVGALLVGWL